MAYAKKTWVDDEIITKDALNNIENGIGTVEASVPTTATTSKAGTVKQCALVADPAGETVTKQEFIALLTALKNAGIMANS